MTTEFQTGPFIFTPEREIRLNGEDAQRWTISYSADDLAVRTLPATSTRAQIVEGFSADISRFVADAKRKHAPELIAIVEFGNDEPLGQFRGSVPEMTPGLINDSSRFWLRSANKLQSRAVSMSEIAALSSQCRAPANAWIAGLLPDDVLTDDAKEWRAPTNWEVRHIVGEGSFTGVTGSAAAELVGISPNNFRKYTAADEAKNRQNISYAAWHLLLHKLGVRSMA